MIDDAANDMEIADHLLSSAMNSNQKKNDTFHIDDEDMMIYLNYAAKQCVTIETVAAEMLDEYYLAVRSVRPGKLKCILGTQ